MSVTKCYIKGSTIGQFFILTPPPPPPSLRWLQSEPSIYVSALLKHHLKGQNLSASLKKKT